MPTVYVDDKPYEVPENTNMLEACLGLGFDLPYFCWHPAMGSVGACRQCAVVQYKDADDDQGQVVMSCMTAAEDGTRISIEAPDGRALPPQRDRMADEQPPPRLPRLRGRRRVPPAGHDRDDRPCLPPLPLQQAHPSQPGPGAVHRARDEPLHRLLPLCAVLP